MAANGLSATTVAPYLMLICAWRLFLQGLLLKQPGIGPLIAPLAPSAGRGVAGWPARALVAALYTWP
jgi:hypothetical protein